MVPGLASNSYSTVLKEGSVWRVSAGLDFPNSTGLALRGATGSATAISLVVIAASGIVDMDSMPGLYGSG